LVQKVDKRKDLRLSKKHKANTIAAVAASTAADTELSTAQAAAQEIGYL
jgi:hypothetical protein